jgi:hypothetical protein
MTVGQPATAHSINSEGLKRRGFTAEQIRNLRNAFRLLYRSGLKLADAERELAGAGPRATGGCRARRVPADVDAQHRALTARAGMQSPPGRCYALVAGEASGDNLGGPLITALAALDPAAAFCGIAGPRMTAAGCTAWYPTDTLAVMGLAEILRHLPRLLRVRRDVIARLLAARPAAFIGIDSPEFNLRIATDLKARGVPDGAVREPAGLGMAPGSRTDDRRGGRPGALRAAVRSRVLRRALRECGIRGAPAGGPHPARKRSRGGARVARIAASCADRRGAAR